MQKIPSEFVSKVTHDLKTPVGNAMMYSDLLSEEIRMLIEEHPDLRDQLESLLYYSGNIRLSSSKLINYVQSWSYAYQIEDGVFEERKSDIHLKDLLDEVIEKNDIFIQTKSLRVDVSYDTARETCHADQEVMTLIMDNLLTLFIGMAPNNESLRIRISEEAGGLMFRFFAPKPTFTGTLMEAFSGPISIKEQIAPSQGILKPGGYALMFVNIALGKMKAAHGVDPEDADPRSFWFRLPMP
ncbi:MAG: sensor histidine kinase [Balneolaceae bacterium]|nr:MAG: sensor histidine kinase [Balneolaceae bacterium]